jgi:hypothetical protein
MKEVFSLVTFALSGLCFVACNHSKADFNQSAIQAAPGLPKGLFRHSGMRPAWLRSSVRRRQAGSEIKYTGVRAVRARHFRA